jgi:hypothetical protein
MALMALINIKASAQLTLQQGSNLHAKGGVVIGLKDINLVNNDPQSNLSEAKLLISGQTDSRFQGPGNWMLGSIIMNKSAGLLVLDQHIQVKDSALFQQGNIDLNGFNVALEPMAIIIQEKENSRFTGSTGGEVFTTLSMNAPQALNPGNLGLVISSAENLGSVTIRRGHQKQNSGSLGNSINRYYQIQQAAGQTINATIRFFYFDAELDTLQETGLDLFNSEDHGTNWTSMPSSGKDATANFVEGAGSTGSAMWTLFSSAVILPVTGLELDARRLTNTTVQLDWRTLQESNNKGFGIERRKENEQSYQQTGFVVSAANGGNSSTPINYQFIDNNDTRAKTYYRLRQEDLDGKITYSNIVMVQGAKRSKIKLTVWPVPSNGTINVRTDGIEGEDELVIYDTTGRVISRKRTGEGSSVQFSGLRPGIYVVTLVGQPELVQKFIVQ